MKIGILQLDTVWEDKEQNFLKVQTLVSSERLDVIVLPEMFNTGFSINKASVEERQDRTESFLSCLASKLKTNVIAGYSIKSDNHTYKNIASVFSQSGRIKAIYEKIHLFSPLGENKIFSRGERPIIFKIKRVPCSVFICYDLRFPEIFRMVARQVYVIFVIANWPKQRAEHWLSLLRARAIENQLFIVGVNRVGVDGNSIQYSGNSAVFGPWGEEILIADDKESFIVCELNISDVKKIRKKYPFLRDIKFNPQ